MEVLRLMEVLREVLPMEVLRAAAWREISILFSSCPHAALISAAAAPSTILCKGLGISAAAAPSTILLKGLGSRV